MDLSICIQKKDSVNLKFKTGTTKTIGGNGTVFFEFLSVGRGYPNALRGSLVARLEAQEEERVTTSSPQWESHTGGARPGAQDGVASAKAVPVRPHDPSRSLDEQYWGR